MFVFNTSITHTPDPDGYGCGMFHQMLNRLYGLRDSSITLPSKIDMDLPLKIAFLLAGLIIFNLHSACADEYTQTTLELYAPKNLKYDQSCTLKNLAGKIPQKILTKHDFTTQSPRNKHWKLSSEWTREQAVKEIQDHCFILKSPDNHERAGVVLSIYTERMSHISTIFLSGALTKEPELITQ